MIRKGMWLRLLPILLLFEITLKAQPVLEWAKVEQELGSYDQFTSDANGNIYQTRFGTFAKYNAQGIKVWQKNLLQPSQYSTTVLMVDIQVYQNTITISGPIYLRTNGTDTVDFDPGPGKAPIVATNAYSAFIARYDSSGKFIFAKKIEASQETDFVFIKSKVDNAGNVYAAGSFRGTIDYDPGAGVSNLYNATNTVWFAKYNTSGNLLFAKKLANTQVEGMDLGGLTIDASNNLCLAGRFKGTTDFDPDAGIMNKTAVGADDAFIARYSTTGTYLQAVNFGASGNIYSPTIYSDAASNLYIIGSFNGTVDIDPGTAVVNLSSTEAGNIFIAKYSTTFAYLWSVQKNGTTGIGIGDGKGNTYVIDRGQTTATFTKYNSANVVQWSGSIGEQSPSYLAVGVNEELFYAGTSGNGDIADLDPGPGDYRVVAPERNGIQFFAKCNQKSSLVSFVSDHSYWKYLDNGSNQNIAWRGIAFNDTSWKSGVGAFGDNGFENTQVISVGHYTTYFRKKIIIEDKSKFASFTIKLLRDDGAVVYVNGVEVFRSNMPTGTITYTTPTSSNVDPPAESQYYNKAISTSAFINGNNVIAVEVHQSNQNNDLSFNMQLVGVRPVPSCTASGTILREYWNGISGNQISQIPLSNAPTGSSGKTIFEGPVDAGDNYGARFRGYVCPPQTGYYTFFIASDDQSELWLSTNDLPSGKVKIAYVSGYTASRQWTKYASQRSQEKYLVAGKKYYIEALHKEATGHDNLAVGWQLPDDTYERPIPGTRLSQAQDSPAFILISESSSWKYLDNGSNQGTAWRSPSFSDIGWKTGTAELGYGDGDEVTKVGYGPDVNNKYITTYFRKSFFINDKTAYSSLDINLIKDDGAVVYLNGYEVYRTNMPTGSITYTALASVAVNPPQESAWNLKNIPLTRLVNGNNVIAVEVHQSVANSADLSFKLKLTARPSFLRTIAEPDSVTNSSEPEIVAEMAIPEVKIEDEQITNLHPGFEFNVFPNPSRGNITIQLHAENDISLTAGYRIYNLAAQVLFEKVILMEYKNYSENLPVENLVPGVYILEVWMNNERRTRRIVLE